MTKLSISLILGAQTMKWLIKILLCGFSLLISPVLLAGYIGVEDIPKIIETEIEGKTRTITVGIDFDGTFVDSSGPMTKAFIDYGDPRTLTSKLDLFYGELNRSGKRWLAYKCKMLEALKLHLIRKDTIIFISRRPDINGEGVLPYLKHKLIKISMFSGIGYGDQINHADMEFVFTNSSTGGTKKDIIKDKGISLYYGDADDEKQAAMEAGAVFVRVLRSDSDIMNVIEALPDINLYEEYVLRNSHLGMGIRSESSLQPICESPSIPKNEREEDYMIYAGVVVLGSFFALLSDVVVLGMACKYGYECKAFRKTFPVYTLYAHLASNVLFTGGASVLSGYIFISRYCLQ